MLEEQDLFLYMGHGDGMPLNVLIGGAPAMIGALWDVLGGDMEMFTCAFLKQWVAQAKGRDDTVGEVGSRAESSMLSAMRSARGACVLPFLTGAAIVCYGIPL